MTRPAPESLILASASPRRRELLAMLDVPFEVAPSSVDEDALLKDRASVEAIAERLALAKATAVASHRKGLVIGADTIVVLDGEVLGKPKDTADARATLLRLRGRGHEVITGVAVCNGPGGKPLVAHAKTIVQMHHYTDAQIAEYVASGDPMDKAGAYAIQHASFRPVERIDGCYLNVVGLPLCILAKLLVGAGYPIHWQPPSDPASCTFCHTR